MRSGSEAGSGCVRRSADAAQSPFSTVGPLGPILHGETSGRPPGHTAGHTYLGPIGRENEEMRGEDRRERLNLGMSFGVRGETAVWDAILVTNQI